MESEIDPNEVDKQGLTALHFAAIHQQPEAAQLLVDAGARVDLPDAWGNRETAHRIGNYDVASCFERA